MHVVSRVRRRWPIVAVSESHIACIIIAVCDFIFIIFELIQVSRYYKCWFYRYWLWNCSFLKDIFFMCHSWYLIAAEFLPTPWMLYCLKTIYKNRCALSLEWLKLSDCSASATVVLVVTVGRVGCIQYIVRFLPELVTITYIYINVCHSMMSSSSVMRVLQARLKGLTSGERVYIELCNAYWQERLHFNRR